MFKAIRNIWNPTNPTKILQAASIIPINQVSNATTPVVALKNTKIIDTSSLNTQKEDTPSESQKTNLRVAKLIMVSAQNNNKYYEMREQSNGTFTALYGRVGSRSSTATYPITQWDKKFREKTRKGYKDQTHLFATKSSVAEFATINNAMIRDLMDDLLRFARQSIFTNYNVSSEEVTKRQVEEAQNKLNILVNKVDMKLDAAVFNRDLIELYSIIPRKMTKVKDHLIETPQNTKDLEIIENKLAEEQATLDVMRGQVELHERQTDNHEEATPQTLLDAFGLQIQPLEDIKLIDSIKKMMGDDADKFKRAYHIVNVQSQQQFDQHVNDSTNQKTELFWHGSRNENWLSILKEGLVLRPANAVITGKMFGYGLYFADKFKKSLNYSSLSGSYWSNGNQNRGFLALYDVHVGKQFELKNHASWCYELNTNNLKKQDQQADSLFAKGGADLRNNEYIVYNQNQCTVRYFVEVC